MKETRAYEALKQRRKQEQPTSQSSLARVIGDWKKPFIPATRARTLIIILFGLTIGMNYYFIMMGKEFLVTDRLFSQDVASDVILVMGIAAIAGYLINGFLIDKLGRRKTLVLFMICFPVSIFFTVLGNDLMVYIGAAMVSLSFWNLGICSRIYCQELYPTEIRGQMTGWRSLFYAMGTTIGSVLGGFLLLNISSMSLGIVFMMYSLVFLAFIPVIMKILPETKNIELSSITSNE
jgi:MFS transporter, putative metabolite:H+ symporter